MKKLLFILVLAAVPAAAQTRTTPCDSIGTAPGLCWSWVAPTSTTPAATYSLYQIPLTGTTCAQFTPTAANRIASAVTHIAYIQSITLTQSLCSEVTAVSAAGVEGPASVVATFLMPQAPGPPTGLQTVAK